MSSTSNERVLALAGRAEKGARFFDAKEPGWSEPERVNVDTLDQDDADCCVFTQLYGSFDDVGLMTVFDQPSPEMALTAAVDHGLIAGYDEPEFTASDGVRLTEFWKAEILARRRGAREAGTPQNVESESSRSATESDCEP